MIHCPELLRDHASHGRGLGALHPTRHEWMPFAGWVLRPKRCQGPTVSRSPRPSKTRWSWRSTTVLSRGVVKRASGRLGHVEPDNACSRLQRPAAGPWMGPRNHDGF
jgi:hypothetical protein